MSVDELTPVAGALEVTRPGDGPGSRQITFARMRRPVTWWSLAASAVSAVGFALGTVVAGRLAEDPTGLLVALLALCVVGGAILDTAGRTAWAGVCDLAEGRLRGDLLS